MSWLARSLVNSLKVSDDDDDDFFDEEDDDEDITNSNLSYNDNHRNQSRESQLEEEDEYEIDESEENQGRGVKEDLSDLTKTLTRQLIGVAFFLAPPPPPPPPLPPLRSSSSRSNFDSSKSDWNLWEKSHGSVSGEKSDQTVEVSDSERDFSENDGRFRNRVSIENAVGEIPKVELPSLGLEESEDKYPIGGAVGVTDEVLVFARNIAMHPETWLDFPLADDEEFGEDYDMSDAQYEHALAVERLAPRFAALRIELCPRHMSEECFWKTYFVLLHPRLNKHDAELLSTQQIVEARALLMQELQVRTKPEPDWLRRPTSYSTESVNSPHSHVSASSEALDEPMPLNKFTYDTTPSVSATDYETTKYPVANSEMRFIDKSVVEEEPTIHNRNKNLLADVQKILDQKYEDDSDDWLEESSEMGDYIRTTIPLGHEEDVSFSDLEDDGSIHLISRQRTYSSDTLSAKDAHPAATGYLGSKQS